MTLNEKDPELIPEDMISINSVSPELASTDKLPMSRAAAAALRLDIDEYIMTNVEPSIICFGDIYFEKFDSGEKGPYAFNPDQNQFGYTTDQPYLSAHFWPLGSGLDSVKRSMAEAVPWLEDVSERYRFVYGVTYEKLAKTALRSFGFESMLRQEEMEVSRACLESIRLTYSLFKGGKVQSAQSFKVAGVVAKTDHLAKAWSGYSEAAHLLIADE